MPTAHSFSPPPTPRLKPFTKSGSLRGFLKKKNNLILLLILIAILKTRITKSRMRMTMRMRMSFSKSHFQTGT
jgi:hypothetical protein